MISETVFFQVILERRERSEKRNTFSNHVSRRTCRRSMLILFAKTYKSIATAKSMFSHLISRPNSFSMPLSLSLQIITLQAETDLPKFYQPPDVPPSSVVGDYKRLYMSLQAEGKGTRERRVQGMCVYVCVCVKELASFYRYASFNFSLYIRRRIHSLQK